jgi:glutamate carboxypeptidase
MRALDIDLNGLPFDADVMLAGLRHWIERESPTFEPAAVSAMVGLAGERLAEFGAAIETIPAPLGLGDCVRAALPHPRAGEPGVLILAHLDTVHPLGTLERLPFRRDGAVCYGPGIVDMKGGTFAAFEAIAELQRAGLVTALPVYVLLTSDEEIGSPGTRELIESEARKHRYVLVPEPSRVDGTCVTGRYAIARFNLTATGRASHAGAALQEGRSAIRLMAERIPLIEAMTNGDCTFSVGVVEGGRWVNCVATTCTGEALSMAKRQADLDAGIERMLALGERDADGVGFEVTLGVVRPVWEPDAGTLALYAQAKAIAATLGFELDHQSAGGGSDGNFTGALGIPTLDGLGVTGAGIHTLDERLHVASLPRAARLLAGLMLTLDAG